MATTREQARWLSTSVGVYCTSDRVVELVGDDAAAWVSGQVTADLRDLTDAEARYALSVTIKGRVLSDLWVVKKAETLSMILPEDPENRALSSMEEHIIMEDVELLPRPEIRVVTLQGPKAEELAASVPAEGLVRCRRLVHFPGVDLWLTADALDRGLEALASRARELGGGEVEHQGWADAHVTLAVPRFGVDFDGGTYPQEAGLKSRAVSFSKGCYRGQEVVYMLENRGQLSRRLVQLRGSAAPALARGALVSDAAGARLGEITSVATADEGGVVTALAYVKRSHAELGQSVRLSDQDFQVTAVVGVTNETCPLVAS